MANARYLAKPSGECCLKGALYEGEAHGTWETVAEVETYVSKPPPEKQNGHIVLYFPDVYGMVMNGLMIMDAFADAGYLALGIDYFRGDAVWKHRKNRLDKNPDFDYQAWMKKHMSFAEAVVPQWVEAVKGRFGAADTKYACVGYCFGAPFVCNELAGKTVSAGAFAHPAFLTETHFRNVKKPLLLSCAETDHTFDQTSRRRALEILQEDGKDWHLQLFSGVEHGFALRSDPHDPYKSWVRGQSLKAILEWFHLWLGVS